MKETKNAQFPHLFPENKHTARLCDQNYEGYAVYTEESMKWKIYNILWAHDNKTLQKGIHVQGKFEEPVT
jgi:hypothetical protein